MIRPVAIESRPYYLLEQIVTIRVSYERIACHSVNSAKTLKLPADVIAGSELPLSALFIRAKIEGCCFLRSVLAQFSHVRTARNSLLLFPLILSFCLVPLFLLPRLFFLALCKC